MFNTVEKECENHVGADSNVLTLFTSVNRKRMMTKITKDLQVCQNTCNCNFCILTFDLVSVCG